jgi:branched-chain amino acid transport system permease protein
MSERQDRDHPREEVQVAREPRPGIPPPTTAIRPQVGRRAMWAAVAAVVAATVLWLAGELIDADRLVLLIPLAGAGVAAGVLAGAVRDPIGRLALYAMAAAGELVTAFLLEAPIFGLLVAAIILVPPVNRVFKLGGRLRAGVGPVRSGLSERVTGPIADWVQPRRQVVRPILGVAVIVLFAIVPFLDDWFDIPDWLAAATSGGTLSRLALFTLFALGMNVVVGFAGLLDLGYVAFWAIGSYTAAILTGAAAYTKGLRAGIVTFEDKPTWEPWMWLILVAALGMALLAGILLGSPTLRLRGDYLAIVTLGFGEIIRITANNLDDVTVGPRGVSAIPHPAIPLPGQGPDNDIVWGTLVDVKYYWLLLAFVVLWVVAIRLLDHSRIGRAWVAIREDEVAAAAMGVPVVRMKLAAFVIGASTAGVGGVIYAEQANFINPPTFDILNSILILCAVVIGGMGSIPGSILGAAAIIVLPEVFREFSEYRIFAFGIALVVVMIFRPQGILPSKRRKAELRGEVVEEQLYEAQVAAGGGGA